MFWGRSIYRIRENEGYTHHQYHVVGRRVRERGLWIMPEFLDLGMLKPGSSLDSLVK